MGGTKIKAKMRASVKPKSKGQPVKPRMAADSGLLTEKIITVVRQKKEAEKSKKEEKKA